MELEEAEGHNPQTQSGVEAPVRNSIEQDDHLILRHNEREDWKEDGKEDNVWSQTDKEDNTRRLQWHVLSARQLSRVLQLVAAILYFFHCVLDLMNSFFAQTVLDTVLTVQQAMFTVVANIETSFTSAIVLLAQVMKKMDFSRGFVGAKSFKSPKVQAVFRYFCMQKTQRWKGCAFLLSIICLNMAPCQDSTNSCMLSHCWYQVLCRIDTNSTILSSGCAKVDMLFKRLIGPFINHSVQYHWGRAHVKSIFVFMCCLTVCQGLVIQEGHPAEFSCSVERIETSLWQRERPDSSFQAIAQGGRVYSWQADKFRIHISNQPGNETGYLQLLTLNNGTAEDDGSYRCEEDGQVKTITNLTVEIPPDMHMEVNNKIENTNEVNVVERTTIKCVAVGGKPPMEISWRVDGRNVASADTNEWISAEGKVTRVIEYLPLRGDKQLTCVGQGHQSTREIALTLILNVQYEPACFLAIFSSSREYHVQCSCSANPDVSSYELYVNDTLFIEKNEAILHSDKSRTVFCIATNEIGNFTTDKKYLKQIDELSGTVSSEVPRKGISVGAAIGIGIGILVFIVVMGSGIFVVVQVIRKKPSTVGGQTFSEKFENWTPLKTTEQNTDDTSVDKQQGENGL